MTVLIASLLITATPVSATQPTVGGGGSWAYTENNTALNVGANLTITNGTSYGGQFVDFAIGSAAEAEFLSLLTDGAPVTTNGVVSVVGTSVYLGNGTIAEIIGSIDAVRNGSSGVPLRVNFTSSFVNPSFENGTTGWTIFNQRIDLGVSALAGCTTVDTSTYPGTVPNSDNNNPTTLGSLTTQSVTTGAPTAGTRALQMQSQGVQTAAPFDVVHGPAVVSTAFEAAAGDTIYFDWRPFFGGDNYHVFGYIIDNDGACGSNVTEVLDATGGGDPGWVTKATVIPTSGHYQFVFVSGTFDATGGQGAGASLLIDNVRVFGSKATDAVVQQVARKLTYRYAGSVPFYVPATRTVTVMAQADDLLSATTTITVNVTPTAEAPVFLDETLGAMHRGVAYNDGVTTRAYPPAAYAISIGSLPPGLILNTSTGAVTGTPTTSGSFPFTIIAVNATGSASRSFTGTVFSPPAFTDSTIGSFRVGRAFVDGVLASGHPAPTYTVSAGGLPGGLILNATTGAITGTPTNASEGSYSFTLTATNSEGSTSAVFAGAVIAHDLGFLGLGPTRLLDTRLTGKRPAGSVVEILVRGVAGVPTDATAVVLNVTVHDPSGSGYLTVFPCGSPIPNASNANFLTGQTIPNSVTAAVGEGGKVCFFTTTAANIIVDLNGAFSPTAGTGTLLGLTPARLLDTRGPSGKLAAGVVRTVLIAGAGGVPADASSVVLNVTVDAPEALGYVTAFPCDSGRPNASNLNFLSGQTVANAVTVAVGASGMVCFYSTATTHLIVDVEAAYSPGSGIGELFWMEPTRIFDSRGAHGEVVAGSIVEIVVAGAFGIPASTIAVALNVTVDSPNTVGFVTVFPCAAAVPYASNLNFSTEQTVANSVLATVGTGGKVCFYVNATTHLIIDVNAAYVDS